MLVVIHYGINFTSVSTKCELVDGTYLHRILLYTTTLIYKHINSTKFNSPCNFSFVNISSLQCYSVLSDILVKYELCIPLERGSNALSTGEGFICLSPPSKLKIAVRFCSIYKKTISFSAIVF